MALLEVKDYSVFFKNKPHFAPVVDSVNFAINKGEIFALAGESGCGKTTLALSVVQLVFDVKQSGSLIYEGQDITKLSLDGLTRLRGSKIGYIFQNTYDILDPIMTIGTQLCEVIGRGMLNKRESYNKAIELLKQVKFENPKQHMGKYPHMLSGGMIQRVQIAIALAAQPNLLIADEPTASIDVINQAQIINLLLDLVKQRHMSLLLISHDLSLVASVADKVAIMYAGQIVEQGRAEQVFYNPLHPYTRLLLSARVEHNQSHRLRTIEGSVPPLDKIKPEGCHFSERIPWIQQELHEQKPTYHEVESGHYVLCSCYKHFYFKI